MKEYDVQKLINTPEIVDAKIKECINNKLLFKQDIDRAEIKGHLLKADHNLRFIAEVQAKDFPDWAITGCYYACYHAALALIQTKGYTSKSHLATMCILIKEFYKNELTEEDIALLSKFLDYKDILFYVEAKNKREDAAYSTKTLFDKKEVKKLRIQAVLFVNKIKNILNRGI
ncbi:DNA-binding protein [Candidatus Woesearchaeota archaeon]|nr:DNA-binding protein [Candidatus Woesearchaeota archaeon]